MTVYSEVMAAALAEVGIPCRIRDGKDDVWLADRDIPAPAVMYQASRIGRQAAGLDALTFDEWAEEVAAKNDHDPGFMAWLRGEAESTS